MSNKAYSSYTIVDVTDGLNWLGELAEAPSPAKQSDAYYNTKEKKSYFYDGTGWVVFSYDAPEGRNYLLESNKLIVNSLYSPHSYKLSTKPEGGALYTVTLKGELGPTRTKFRIYNTVGEAGMVDLVSKGDNIHQVTFNWVSGQDTALKIYVLPDNEASESRIEWIKMEKGSIATPWSPAPEDALKYEVTLSNENATISTDKDGAYDAAVLKTASTVEVIVTKGTENITNQCTFAWTATGGTLQNVGSVTNNYFKSLSADTGTATITITLPNKETITKTFIISKNKQGVPGANGTTPHVGDNGNWYIGTTDTGITAQGPAGSDGNSPYIKDGNWWIGNTDTGVAAKGPQGNDGKGIKSQVYNTAIRTFTYYHNSSSQTPSVAKPAKPTADSTSGGGDWPWKTYCTQMWWETTYTNNITETSAYTYSPWSEWELACSNAAEVKAFNTLTNNGQFEGHFYGVYVWVKEEANTNPTAYFYETSGATKHLIVPKDSDLTKDTLRIQKIEGKWDRVDSGGTLVNGKDEQTLKSYLDYYVNASMIQTGSLLVGTDEKPILKAGFNDNTVQIAGFSVNENSLKNEKWYATVYWIGQYPVFTLQSGEEAEAEEVELLDKDLNADVLYITKIDGITVSTNQDANSGKIVNVESTNSPSDYLKQYKYSRGVYLGTDGIYLGKRASQFGTFQVDKEGNMRSTSGTIGGWNITDSKLSSITKRTITATNYTPVSYLYAFSLESLNDPSQLIYSTNPSQPFVIKKGEELEIKAQYMYIKVVCEINGDKTKLYNKYIRVKLDSLKSPTGTFYKPTNITHTSLQTGSYINTFFNEEDYKTLVIDTPGIFYTSTSDITAFPSRMGEAGWQIPTQDQDEYSTSYVNNNNIVFCFSVYQNSVDYSTHLRDCYLHISLNNYKTIPIEEFTELQNEQITFKDNILFPNIPLSVKFNIGYGLIYDSNKQLNSINTKHLNTIILSNGTIFTPELQISNRDLSGTAVELLTFSGLYNGQEHTFGLRAIRDGTEYKLSFYQK